MDRVAELRRLIADGLELGDVLRVFAERNDEYASRMIDAAREQWHRDGEVEIDEASVISCSGDGGEYVLAWVWVDDPEADAADDADD